MSPETDGADRLQNALSYEERFWSRGLSRVAGVDEVGRGPLAGPVVAAAVILEPGVAISGARDSKAHGPPRGGPCRVPPGRVMPAAGQANSWQSVQASGA